MKTNPNDPAFPSHGTMGEVCYEGLTKREIFAIKVLQGLLHNETRLTNIKSNRKECLAESAISFADVLIQKLNEQSYSSQNKKGKTQ